MRRALAAETATRALTWCGGTFLFLAAATDFLAVLGRHLGFGLFGATEIVQWLIVGIVSTALVAATLRGGHAAVHLLEARLPPAARALQRRAADAATAVVLLIMLAGSVWVFLLLLPLGESSDLIGLPIAPARLLWATALLLAAMIAAIAAWRGR